MSIENRVKRSIAEYLKKDAGQIKNSDAFIADLSADSLDAIQIIMNLENEFCVEISDSEAEQIVTVQDAIDKIKEKYSDIK